MSVQYFEGIGRRKESTARVRLMSGTGKFTVNDKPVEEYFPRTGDIEAILGPLAAAQQDRATFDITATVQRRWCDWSDRFCPIGSCPRAW